MELAPIQERLREQKEFSDSFVAQMCTCFHHVPFQLACEECGREADPYIPDVSALIQEVVKLRGIVQTFHWLESDYAWCHLWKNAQRELLS